MAGNELNSTAVVPMPPQFREAPRMGRLPTPLSDRNVLLDEIVAIKHDMKVMQLEARRIEDDMRHRLSGVDARLHAGEANARTIDKREADHFDGAQQQRREADARHKEVIDEMLRFRRDTEADLRGLNQETRNEIRERDAHVQQLDALARTLTGRLKALEEDRASLMDTVNAEMDRRLKLVQDDSKRQQQQSLERLMVLERIIQRETDERTKGDIEVRQELSQVLLAVKAVSKQEATNRLGLQRELRAEVQEASKALQEQARAMHDNAQLAHTRMQDQLQEEKMLREETGRSVQRQMESFLRNNENERQRLAKTVHDAVTHMSERTASAQTISKRLQEESSEVKRLALRLQEQAAFGLKNLAEKVEEGLRSLRATQDRHCTQFVDVKEDLLNSLKEQREKIFAIESRVQSEMTRNLTEERAARESTITRLRDCEELQRQMERKVWNKYTQLEDTTTRAVESIKKDGDAARGKVLAATADLRTEVYDQRQKLQALEVQTDLKVSKQLNELRTAHGKVEVAVDESKARVADMGRLVDATLAGQGQRLAALESTLRDHVQQTLRDKEADVFRNASIMIQHANVGRPSKDGNLVAAAPEEMHTDLSFLDFHVQPPVSSQETTLKKLEFNQDIAPPPRPSSPDFVRKSPKKVALEPSAKQEAAEQQKEGETAVGEGELAAQSAVDAKQEEGVVEEVGQKSGEDSMGGYGDDSMEGESVEAAARETGEESFHESYDGGMEDARETDADVLPPEDDAGAHAHGADGQAQDAAATKIQARARGARDRKRVQAIKDSNTAGAGGAEDEGDQQGGTEEAGGADEVGEAGEAGAPERVTEVPETQAESAETKEEVKSNHGKSEEEEEEEEGEAPVQSEQERAQMEALEDDVRAVINKARLGRSKDFKELIANDASLLTRAVDGSGNTLFHIAAANGKKKIVKELLRQKDKIDVYARNNKGQNALDCALQYSFHELAEYLKEKHPKLADPPPSADNVGAEVEGEAAGASAGAATVDGKEEAASIGAEAKAGEEAGGDAGKDAELGAETEAEGEGESEAARAAGRVSTGDTPEGLEAEATEVSTSSAANVDAEGEGEEAGKAAADDAAVAGGATGEGESAAPTSTVSPEPVQDGSATSVAEESGQDLPGTAGGNLERAGDGQSGAEGGEGATLAEGGKSSEAVELSESVEELADTGAGSGLGEKAEGVTPLIKNDDVKDAPVTPSEGATPLAKNDDVTDVPLTPAEGATPLARDDDVTDVPVTPPKAAADQSAGAGDGGEAGDIVEDVVAESPDPAPVEMTTGQ